ncbi:unnamed protein product [Linum trigynum]|uniref:Uncharacterized protein n=1 Tax=Linum trigynum TaxID=586398 RepID=A0AAV2CGR7_9ROSI
MSKYPIRHVSPSSIHRTLRKGFPVIPFPSLPRFQSSSPGISLFSLSPSHSRPTIFATILDRSAPKIPHRPVFQHKKNHCFLSHAHRTQSAP